MVLKISFEKQKMAAPIRKKNFHDFERSFLNLSFARTSPHGLRLNSESSEESKTNKNQFSVIIFLGLKDCYGFEGVRKVSTFPLVPFAFVATFGLNYFIKVLEAAFSIQKW